jgi:hypothetical protein
VSDLADFLLARIAETEATAREDQWDHLAPIWVDYILDECKAKRAIIAQIGDGDDMAEVTRSAIDRGEWDDATAATVVPIAQIFDRFIREDGEATLRALAYPYRDHLDFRPEWRTAE